MKNKYILISFIIIFFLGLIIVIRQIIFPIKSDNKIITINIPHQSSLKKIAGIIYSNNIIKSPFIFKLLTKITGNENKLKAGEYEFNLPISMWEILKKIKNGDLKKYGITIPEGYSVSEIAELISRKGIADKQKFLKLVRDKKILNDYKIDAESLEGYLFPDTYYVYKGISEEKIIRNMLDRFFYITNKDFEKREKELNLSRHEIIILASMVEKEAMIDDERRIIAKVFLNRLKKHLKLESCATVLYALNIHKEKLYENDLKVDSPYNTYLHLGLPKGPISNPGRSSIYAVLYPGNVDFLFFVSRNDGTHEFTTTFSDHKKNKRKFKK